MQGTVVLTVLVDAQGKAETVTFDARDSTTDSANLISAATEAVMNWRFHPIIKDGRPVAGYARIPVRFDITPLDKDPSASGAPRSAG